jgi:hypothetical protein
MPVLRGFSLLSYHSASSLNQIAERLESPGIKSNDLINGLFLSLASAQDS